jgi:hypothetical protein
MSITGRKVVQAAISDTKSFFVRGHQPKIMVELGTRAMREHACFSGKGSKSKLCFSKDFCSSNVENVDDLNFFLLIVGHELAHYLHDHNQHQDAENIDSKSVEAWADFYGTKLMMTLITYGSRTMDLYSQLDVKFHGGIIIESIGRALSRLATTLFVTDSKKYSPRIARVGFCAAGITSFLDKNFGDMKVQRSLDAMTRIYSQGELEQLLFLEREAFELDRSLLENAMEIHEKIQGIKLSITQGLKIEYFNYLSTSFHTTKESRDLYIKQHIQQAKKQGFDIPELV